MLAVTLIAFPNSLGSEEDVAETVAPFQDLTATPVAVAVNLESGEGVEVNVTLDVRSMEGGILFVEPDLGDGRFLLTLTSPFQDIQQTANNRLDWLCDLTECSITATARIDAFTDLSGEVFVSASGGMASGELPADAAATVRVGDAAVGRAKAYELVYSFLGYPDNSDQAPHAGLDVVDYDLGDPSDEIELVVRPLLGEIGLEGGGSGTTPSWAQNVIPIVSSTTCAPSCGGRALIQMGPSDFSNLEYQIIAYSERPGAGATANADRTAATATTEIGFVTATPDDPVTAIPITLTGNVEQTRLMGDVGVRGRSSFVNLRPAGDPTFEPATNWIVPTTGETDFELAISTPDAQGGEVEISWTITLFEIPSDSPTTASIQVGSATQATFAAGQTGDPSEFEPIPGTSDGSGFPLPLALAGLGVVGLGGYGAYRYSSRNKPSPE